MTIPKFIAILYNKIDHYSVKYQYNDSNQVDEKVNYMKKDEKKNDHILLLA